MRLAAEAEMDLCGWTVEGVRRHPVSRRLLIVLGAARGKRYLLIGARGTTAAFYWSRQKGGIADYDRFVRSEALNRLRGARLATFTVPGADRLIRLEFHKPDKEGDGVLSYAVVISWAGAAGNLWLLDGRDDRVLEAIWAETESTLGNRFAPPKPPALIDWRVPTFPEYEKRRRERPDQSLAEFLRKTLWGVDGNLAGLIEVSAARGLPESVPEIAPGSRWAEFECVIGTLRRAVDPETKLRLSDADPARAEFAFAGSETPTGATGTLISLAAGLALIDAATSAESAVRQLRDRLRTTIDQALKRARRRATAAAQAVSRGEEAESLQREADLLGANRHLLARGQKLIELTDWQADRTIAIRLDPARTPQENIDAAYRRARSAVRAAEQARGELPSLTAERERWEALHEEIERADLTDERMEEIRIAIGAGDGTGKTRRSQSPRLPYREFTIGPYRLLVGRSRRDNDELTLHVARPDDLFLHAQGVPGSHVILRHRDRKAEFDHQVIGRAAQVAAFFSRAKHSHLVAVSFVLVRYVRKPRKAPPGLVRLEREETLMVEPLPPPGYHGSGGSGQ